jgi:hypothetical protein
MEHYICTDHDQPLASCACSDDMHFGAFQQKPVESPDEDIEIPM